MELVWRRADVKDLFQVYGLWPHFVGQKNDSVLDFQGGVLPVVKTKQQNIYIQEFENKCLNSRKRKLSLDSNNSNFNDNSPKRAKFEYISTFISSIYQGLTVFLSNLFHSTETSKVKSEEEAIVSELKISDPIEIYSPENISFNDKVFLTLKQRGFFVGPGGNYGGDYTLYVGKSPANSHSSATVRVIDSDKAMIPFRDVVALSRVQTQVNKTAILAFRSRINSNLTSPLSETNEERIVYETSNETDKLKFIRLNFKDVARRL